MWVSSVIQQIVREFEIVKNIHIVFAPVNEYCDIHTHRFKNNICPSTIYQLYIICHSVKQQTFHSMKMSIASICIWIILNGMPLPLGSTQKNMRGTNFWPLIYLTTLIRHHISHIQLVTHVFCPKQQNKFVRPPFCVLISMFYANKG